MAFHTQAGFARCCGTTRQTIKNAVRRGNLFLSGNGMLDDEILENAAYLRRWQEKGMAQPDQKVLQDSSPGLFDGLEYPDESDPVSLGSKNPVNSESKVGNRDKFIFDREKAAADLKKKQLDIEKSELEMAKRRGELVPVEAVKSLVFEFSRAMSMTFKNGAELLVTEMAHETGMGLTGQAAMRTRLIDLINSSNKNAVDHARDQLRGVVSEFSESRNVGQHD